MRKKWLLALFPLLAAVALWPLLRQPIGERTYYALEKSGQLAGYVVETTFPAREEAPFPVRILTRVNMMVSLMGQDHSVEIKDDKQVDPVTGELRTHSILSRTGFESKNIHIGLAGDEIRLRIDGGEPRVIHRAADVALDQSPRFWQGLKQDFLKSGLMEKTYRVFDYNTSRVVARRYRNEGRETLHILGEDHEPLNFKAQPPVVVMLAGLQGAGKTTTAAKLAKKKAEIASIREGCAAAISGRRTARSAMFRDRAVP